MISCPKCHASLPDWAKTCQFCQNDVTKVVRPVAVKTDKGPLIPVAPWVWGAYYALSVYFLLNGGYEIFSAFRISHQKILGEEIGFGFASIFVTLLGAFHIVLGIGLLFQIQVLRNVVNFILGMSVLLGILNLALSLPGVMIGGFYGFLSLMTQALQIAASAFMIYLIGETDKTAPNI